MVKYDLVVIGGGVGGLTAGAYAARRGLSVVVCEQNAVAGGLLAPYGQDGFHFDLRMPTLLNMGIVAPILSELGIDGAGLQRPSTWQVIAPRGPIRVDTLRSALEQLAEQYPQQAGTIQTLAGELDTLARTLWQHFDPNPLLLHGARAWGSWALDAIASMGQLYRLWLATKLTVDEGLRRYPLPDELRSLMIQLGYEPMSYLLLAGLWRSFATDYFLPPRGISQMPIVLEQKIRLAGGEIATQAKVEEIFVQGGRAAGVRLADGRVIRARAVIGACDLVTLYGMLAGHRPFDRLHAQAVSTPVAQSYVSLFLGLKQSACDLPFSATHTSWLPDAGVLSATEGPNFHRRGLIISSPSLDSCGFAPQGSSTLVISTPAAVQWFQGPEQKVTRQQALADITNQLTERWPEIKDRIVTQRLLTPVDYERITGGRLGSSAGWSMDPHRSIPTNLIPWRTPLPGLYLAGHWTARPGGVAGAMLTARMAVWEVRSGS